MKIKRLSQAPVLDVFTFAAFGFSILCGLIVFAHHLLR